MASRTLAVIGALGLALAATAGCTTAPPTPQPHITTQAPPVAPARGELQRLAPARITIPDLELDRPLVSLGLDDAGAHEVPVGAVDVGWYRGGPAPGEVGPALILGHVNWAGQRGSFARLSSLLPGDLVTVDARMFLVYDVQLVPKASFPVQRVYGRTDGPELRLITCGGELDATGHNYLDNVIVYAREASPVTTR